MTWRRWWCDLRAAVLGGHRGHSWCRSLRKITCLRCGLCVRLEERR